ncbi:MAG: hypothetical protein II875_09215, partial [Clostridia bacterium]|nr:hypothetical protein [Clostridia bacterium]
FELFFHDTAYDTRERGPRATTFLITSRHRYCMAVHETNKKSYIFEQTDKSSRNAGHKNHNRCSKGWKIATTAGLS